MLDVLFVWVVNCRSCQWRIHGQMWSGTQRNLTPNGHTQKPFGLNLQRIFSDMKKTSEREGVSVCFLCVNICIDTSSTITNLVNDEYFFGHTKDWNLTTRGPANLALLVVLVGELCYSRSRRRRWLWLLWWFGGAFSWLSFDVSSEATAFAISKVPYSLLLVVVLLGLFPLMCNLKQDR